MGMFGSYAKGMASQDSDIDLAVFSEDFNRLSRLEATALLYSKLWGIRLNIEPLGFGVDKLIDTDPFIDEILQTGKVIYSIT